MQPKRTTESVISRILSYILHPALLPVFVTLAVHFLPSVSVLKQPGYNMWFVLLTVITFSLLIPAILVGILRFYHLTQTIELTERRERIIPLTLSLVSYSVMLKLLGEMQVNESLHYLLTIATSTLFAGLAIHYFYKISLHTLGWGALTAAVFSLSIANYALLPLLMGCILLSGLAGYARLSQNAHNHSQVYWGYAAGILVVAVMSLWLHRVG